MEKFQVVLIFLSVMVGVVSAVYLYQAVGEFLTLLKRPLRIIATGMFVVALGVLLAAFISYEASFGIVLGYRGVPLSAFFYLLYFIGSLTIFFGVRQLSSKTPNKTVDVSLQG